MNGIESAISVFLILTVVLISVILLWKSHQAYIQDNDNNRQAFIGNIIAIVALLISVILSVILFVMPTLVDWVEELLPPLGKKIVVPEGGAHVTTYEGHTYCICVRSDVESYWDAERIAEECNGHLAVINNADENKMLYDFYIRDLGYKSAYFGYTDANSEDDWYWVDGSETEEGGFTSWKMGQPDNSNYVEEYALFWRNDPAYKWNDGDFGKDPDTGTVNFLIEWDFSE